MESPRYIVVATVRNRLQAEVLTKELARRGIGAEVEEISGPRQLGPRLSAVRVPESQFERARQAVAEITGREKPGALLSMGRLVFAILFMAVLIAAIAWIVDLVV